MGRRYSNKDAGAGLMLILMILALPIFLIIWIANAVSKSSNKTKSNNLENNNYSSYNGNDEEDNRLFPNKTKEQLKQEAESKYNRISENKKQHYLKKRKRFLLILYISLSICAFIYGLLFIGANSSQNGGKGGLIFGIVCIIISISLIIALIVNLKRESENLILEQIVKELKNLYNKFTKETISENLQYVQRNSPMYKNIQELNSRYTFNRNVCSIHSYSEELNSKRQLDNFNYNKWIMDFIDENEDFFETMQGIYEENCKKYDKYIKEYKALKQYRTEIEVEDLDIEFEIFNYIEKYIFEQSKHPAIVAPQICLETSYTSPSGRNYYDNSHTYRYNELLNLLDERNEIEAQKLLNQQKQRKAAEEKRAKEKRLRELDKLEHKLAEREKEINEREKEFIEATKEHIYTASKVEVNNQDIEIDENLSLSQKLKLLKEKYDNGQITYEEYQSKRKELM